MGSTLYFQAYTPDTGIELFAFDGEDISIVEDLQPGTDSSSPRNLTGFAGKLFYVANSPEHGVELFLISEGEGPELVADIRPDERGSDPEQLFIAGEKMYFSANDGESGLELWQWSEANGAQQVTDISEGVTGSDPHAFIQYDDVWTYFTARTERYGFETWRTDGSTTEMLLDAWPGSNGSTPNDYGLIGNQVCFSAQDGIHGRELWCISHDEAVPVMSR